MKTVEVQFDEAMLGYVKELELKTVTFGGYDKNDVFDKIKQLLDRARQVCVDLTLQQAVEVERKLRKELEEESKKVDSSAVRDESDAEIAAPAADEPNDDMITLPKEEFESVKLQAEQLDIAESTIAALQRELQAVERELQEEKNKEKELREEMEASRSELLKQAAEREKAELAVSQVEQNTAEQEELTAFAAAADILREARLEGARLIDEARQTIDQEIIKGRAMHKAEEEKTRQEIAELKAERDLLYDTCVKYRGYLDAGNDIMGKLREYAAEGEFLTNLSEAGVNEEVQ